MLREYLSKAKAPSPNSRKQLFLEPKTPPPPPPPPPASARTLLQSVKGGDKMELRSRGDLKVVWRSSRHLVCSSQLSLGKARYPQEEEFSWLSGYSGGTGKSQVGFWRIPESIRGDSDGGSLHEPAAAAGKPSAHPHPPNPDLQPAQVRIREHVRNRGLSGARAQQPHPPQPRITHRRCCLARHESATGSRP